MSTKPVEQGAGPEIPVKDFASSNCGQYAGTATGDLPIDCLMSINGSVDLSNCVVGPSGAYVQSIQYKSRGGIRHGEIIVYGAGPSGTGSGRLHLVFESSAGEEHTLSLFSSSPGEHTDRFEDTSDLVSVSWYHS
jgi:hypothetical protein